jgi:hypothetical protein
VLKLSLTDFRRVGRKRANTAHDLAGYFAGSELDTDAAKMLDVLSRPIAGGAQEVLTIIANPAAVGAAAATWIGPILSVPQDPLVLALNYIPTIAAVSAASTMIFNMRRTDTPAVIQSGTIITGTAQTQVGAITLVGIVPFGIPAANGVDAQAQTSAGAGTITVSATSPGILALIGVA